MCRSPFRYPTSSPSSLPRASTTRLRRNSIKGIFEPFVHTTTANGGWHRRLVDQRASARTLLAVHKAALGSHAHADRAAAAVDAAARLLDGHHGSASGLCMAPPGKGSAKGGGKGSASNTETWEQKHTRLKKEITEAAKQGDDLTFLNKIFQAHLISTRLTFTKPQPKVVAPKPKAGSFSATNKAKETVQQSQKQLDEAARIAAKARDDHAASVAERNRLSSERSAKAKADKEALRLTGVPRETQICPLCTYTHTYASSAKCHHCKVAFLAPRVPAPQAAAPPPKAAAVAVSPLEEAALATLSVLQSRTFAVVAAGTQPGPPAPAPPPAVLPVLPGAAPPAVPPPPTPSVADAEQAADFAEAKLLMALRAKKLEAEKQRDIFKDSPDVHGALQRRATELEAEVSALLAKRQLAMAPHQLGVVLGQRQLSLSTAQQHFATRDAAAKVQVEAFDLKAKEIDAGFLQEIVRVTEAQKAQRDGFAAQRTTLCDQINAELLTAKEACLSAQKELQATEAAHATQSGTAKATAEAAAVVAKTAADAAQQAAEAAAANQALAVTQAADDQARLRQEHADAQQRMREEATAAQAALQSQLDAQKALIVQQEQLLATQQLSFQPSAFRPPVDLPAPTPPADGDTGMAWFRLRQFLLLIAQQDLPVTVSWADLEQFRLPWTVFLTLVPLEIAKEVMPGLSGIGPDSTAAVPRRLLACLRDQMDTLAHVWLTEQAKASSRAEIIQEANAFAQKTLDEAKRIQERKRPAESSAEKEQRTAA